MALVMQTGRGIGYRWVAKRANPGATLLADAEEHLAGSKVWAHRHPQALRLQKNRRPKLPHYAQQWMHQIQSQSLTMIP